MIFLDPKTDLVFKKLFGTQENEKITIDFLNSVLGRTEGNKITSIIINDPQNLPDAEYLKHSIVDVRCTDQAGNKYIVEMQVKKEDDYAIRAQYYGSLALNRQLGKKEAYGIIVPVIFVGILDFVLFKKNTDRYISHHYILDEHTGDHELKHLEFHFIELPKFNKQEHELISMIDKWIYLFKQADSLRTVPKVFKEESLKEACEVLEQGTWSPEELEFYDRVQASFHIEASLAQTARNEGIEAGELKAKREMVKSALKENMPLAVIVRLTGLTEEEIKRIQKELR